MTTFQIIVGIANMVIGYLLIKTSKNNKEAIAGVCFIVAGFVVAALGVSKYPTYDEESSNSQVSNEYEVEYMFNYSDYNGNSYYSNNSGSSQLSFRGAHGNRIITKILKNHPCPHQQTCFEYIPAEGSLNYYTNCLRCQYTYGLHN